MTEETVKDIRKRLEEYDSSRPKMDEIKFIRNIMDDYNLNRDGAIKLIRSVRKLNKKK